MGKSLHVSIAGGVLAVTVIASAVLNLVIAISLSQSRLLTSSTALFLIAFSFQLVVLICLTYYHLFLTQNTVDTTKQRPRWILYWAGLLVSTVAMLCAFAASVWLASWQSQTKGKQRELATAGVTISIVYIVLHVVYFVILFCYTKQNTDPHTVPCVTITHTSAGTTQMSENKRHTGFSFGSREPTLASRACTPTSSRTYSLHSATTRVGTSIRSKVGKGRGSARSSLDLPALPGTEMRSSSPNAFDRWETSTHDPDTRSTVVSSSPMLNRSGLDTIPGSRTVTPNRSLERVQIPTILSNSSIPPISKSPKLQKLNLSQTPKSKMTQPEPPSSPPSSPPNFSRPTSKHQTKASITGLGYHGPRTSASMNDLIHPLFRPNSPSPPQILTSGTMVTASPLANQPITPKTLSRLRSDSQLRHHKSSFSTSTTNANITVTSPSGPKRQSSGQWRTMPNVEANYAAVMAKPRPRSKSHSSTTPKRPNTAGSITVSIPDATDFDNRPVKKASDQVSASSTVDTVTPTSPNDKDYAVGSPGPSIADEEDLPPILPGFVLSAGTRSSLIEYGKRKSVKRASAKLSLSQL